MAVAHFIVTLEDLQNYSISVVLKIFFNWDDSAVWSRILRILMHVLNKSVPKSASDSYY